MPNSPLFYDEAIVKLVLFFRGSNLGWFGPNLLLLWMPKKQHGHKWEKKIGIWLSNLFQDTEHKETFIKMLSKNIYQ